MHGLYAQGHIWLHRVTHGHNGLHKAIGLYGATQGYILHEGYIRLYTELHKTTKGLHGVTQGYMGLHMYGYTRLH